MFGLTSHKLQKVIDAYLNGDSNVTISGTKYLVMDISSLRIFQHDVERTPQEVSEYYLGNINFREKGFAHFYLPPETLLKMGKEVTDTFIQDKEYGENIKHLKPLSSNELPPYINNQRIKELQSLTNNSFDFTKLIQLCKELNDNYSRGNFLTVAMIGRTILNHIPPIFGLKSFEELANNYGGLKDHRSFKKNMAHLNDSFKNIADSHLHLQIRKKEILPTENQIDFKQDLDVLLAEIIRIS